MNKALIAKNAEEYVLQFPASLQPTLQKLRKTIKAAAPKAEEVISYQMPAYKYHGMLVYFAAYQNHIGFYPGAAGIEAFKKEIAGYKWAKGTVQFPLDKPVPWQLVTDIVKYRVLQNEEKTIKKLSTKKIIK